MFGIEITPEHRIDRLVDLGVRAEAAGYDAVFSTCHYNNRDPWTYLSQLATATDEVRLGPGVANPYETHPVTLASKVATAQRLWAGERVDHEGTFDASDAGLNYQPPQGADVPVHVGGEGPHMCRMAAKHADGLLFNGSHPADLEWARGQVEQGLEERPDARGGFDLLAYASVSVADDAAAAREAARPAVAFIAAGAAPPVLRRHGIDADAAGIIGERISAGEFSAAFEAVTPAMIDAFCAAGDREAVRERLAGVLEHADGVVIGSPLGPDLEAAIDLAADAADGLV